MQRESQKLSTIAKMGRLRFQRKPNSIARSKLHGIKSCLLTTPITSEIFSLEMSGLQTEVVTGFVDGEKRMPFTGREQY